MMPTKYVREWLERGDEDIHAVSVLLEEGGLANVACFHAQQAAEKYLKGFLAYYGKNIRKIHSLESLLADCLMIDTSFQSLRDDAIFLGRFYVETRYPGDASQFSISDARKALDAAVSVKDFVLKKIRSSPSPKPAMPATS